MFPTRAASALAVLTAIVTQQQAHANEQDTLIFRARQALLYDSNVFRSSGEDSNNPVRSDTLSRSSLGMELDKRYSLQRVELDASVVANRYRSTEYLNFNALNYRAVWHWSLTPRLYGTLRREQDEELNTYDYYGGFERNVRTDRVTGGTAEAVLGRDWRLLGGLERETRSNERPIAQQGDFTLRNTSIGLRHLFPSGSSISYRLLDGQGSYQNRVPGVSAAPTSFDQFQHELRVAWSITGKTSVAARIAYLKREHSGFAFRDYSGPVGDINVQWSASGKLRFQGLLARGLSANQTNTSSYFNSTRVAINTYWSTSAKTILSAGYEQVRHDFDGVPPGITAESREDKINTMRVGMRWNPIDALALSAGLQRSRRTSTANGAGYTNNSASVDATFSF